MFLGFECETKGGGAFHEHGDVICVETTEDEAGVGSHLLAEQRHVVQQYVTVDVRQNQVEKTFHLII